MPELTALIEALETKRQEKIKAVKIALLAEFRDKTAELGTSLKGLMSSPHSVPERKPRRSKGDKIVPKHLELATSGT